MKKLIVLVTLCLLFTITAVSQTKNEWEKVQSLNSWNVYQQFIISYPNGKYTEQAKQKLALLKQQEPVKKVEEKKVVVEVPVEKNNVALATPEINQISQSTPVRKGKITLRDGQSINFRNLTLKGNTISFTNSEGNTINKETSQVFKVTRYSNFAGYGALLGGLSGLLGALQGINEVNSVNNSLGVKTENNDNTGLVVGLTIGGAVFGGLVGLMFKSEKTIYKNNAALSFYPSINSMQGGN